MKRKKKTALVKNIDFLILAIGVISVWRGIWYLQDTYLLPDNPLLSAIVSIGAGIAILYANDHRLSELYGA